MKTFICTNPINPINQINLHLSIPIPHSPTPQEDPPRKLNQYRAPRTQNPYLTIPYPTTTTTTNPVVGPHPPLEPFPPPKTLTLLIAWRGGWVFIRTLLTNY